MGTKTAAYQITYNDDITQLAITGAQTSHASFNVTASIAPINAHIGTVGTLTDPSAGGTRALLGTISVTRNSVGQITPGVATMAAQGVDQSGYVQINGSWSPDTTSTILVDFDSTTFTQHNQLATDLVKYESVDNITGIHFLQSTGVSVVDNSGPDFLSQFNTYDLELDFNNVPSGQPTYFTFDYSAYGLTVDHVAVVPEPSGLVLLGVGAMGLLGLARRPKKKGQDSDDQTGG